MEVDDQVYTVREMALLHTVFEDQYGTLVMAANNLLFQKFIKNVRRSGDMSETVVIETDARTEYIRILAFERKMHEFLRKEKREYHEGIGLTVREIWQDQKIVLELEIPHKGNPQEEVKWNRRHNKVSALKLKSFSLCLHSKSLWKTVVFTIMEEWSAS